MPSPVSQAAMSPNLYTSSVNLFQKLRLPERAIFVGRDDTYNYGEVQVRRHNGLFWNSYKKKRIVLLKNGRLFIYSDCKYGVNVNLVDLGFEEFYSEKKIEGREEMKCKCEIVLRKGKTVLGICIKGARVAVTQWRRGFVLSSHGLTLGEAKETDELIWSQIDVNPHTSEDVLASITNCTLRANQSMASMSMLYKSHTLPHKKNYTEVIACLKSNTLGTMRGRTASSLSFYSEIVGSELALTAESLYDETSAFDAVDCEMPDSGISSPEPGDGIQCKFHQKPSRLEGIPMLSASILCFDAAFPATSDEE